MFTSIVWPALSRLLFGALILFLLIIMLPHTPVERHVWGGLLGLLAPLLVVGRRESLNRASYHLYQRTLPSPRLWELKGLFPALSMLCLWALVVSRGAPKATLVYCSWYALCALTADCFDVRRERLGEAWAYSFVTLLILISAPLWGAIWFGDTALSPWPATLSLGLHPVFAAVSSSAESALQAPLLYQYTLSGLVEVRTTPWWCAPLCYLTLSVLLLELIVQRPLTTEQRYDRY